MQEAGHRGRGCRKQDTGQDAGSRTQGAGHRAGCREQDTEELQASGPPGPQEAVGFLVEPLTHHLRGGGVPGKVMHSRRRQVMLIVLWDGPHLELSGTQAGVHTEVPAGTQVA